MRSEAERKARFTAMVRSAIIQNARWYSGEPPHKAGDEIALVEQNWPKPAIEPAPDMVLDVAAEPRGME